MDKFHILELNSIRYRMTNSCLIAAAGPTVVFLGLSTFFKIYTLFAKVPYKALTVV
jgi:hypothetical protein